MGFCVRTILKGVSYTAAKIPAHCGPYVVFLRCKIMKKRYFNSACPAPRVVYGVLLILIVMFFSLGLAGSTPLYASIDKGPGLNAARSISSVPLERGRFLVARGIMKDAHFNKTVIYLIDYNPLGAIGVIINRPLKLKLSKVLPEYKWLKKSELTLSWGGPVENRRLTLLALSETPLPGTEHMGGKLYAGWDVMLLRNFLSNSGAESNKVRAFAGFAGWAPGQLESEVARGGWRVMEAPHADIFRDTKDLWFELMGRP